MPAASNTPPLRDTAIVCGAGMGGLLAAAVLAEHFQRVLIVERDRLPKTPALRNGVSQGAHVHTLNGFAGEGIEALLPGFTNELLAAGAVQIRRNKDVWFHDPFGPTPIRDLEIDSPSMSRPLLEHVTRTRVAALSGVEFLDQCRVRSVTLDESQKVNGLLVSTADGTQQTLQAELVIDCTGRATRLPRWLKDWGFGAVERQQLQIAMTYTSALFRPPAGWDETPAACLIGPQPSIPRGGYVTPIEGGLWIVTLYGRGQDIAPADLQGFVEWSRGLPHPVIHERLAQAELASDFHTYGLPTGRWFRYDLMDRFPEGILPLGEAICAYNPMYGQGIGLACAQALALQDGLRARSGQALNDLASDYFAGCTARNQLGWSIMETADLMFATTEGKRPADIEARWQFARTLHDLLPDNPGLHRQSLRVTHLLDPPSTLERFKVLG